MKFAKYLIGCIVVLQGNKSGPRGACKFIFLQDLSQQAERLWPHKDPHSVHSLGWGIKTTRVLRTPHDPPNQESPLVNSRVARATKTVRGGGVFLDTYRTRCNYFNSSSEVSLTESVYAQEKLASLFIETSVFFNVIKKRRMPVLQKATGTISACTLIISPATDCCCPAH